MCGFFEFSDLAQKKWKEIRFKFEIWQKFYMYLHRQKNFYGNYL